MNWMSSTTRATTTSKIDRMKGMVQCRRHFIVDVSFKTVCRPIMIFTKLNQQRVKLSLIFHYTLYIGEGVSNNNKHLINNIVVTLIRALPSLLYVYYEDNNTHKTNR